MVLKDHNAVTLVRLVHAAPRSRVKHSTNEPLSKCGGIDFKNHNVYPLICTLKSKKAYLQQTLMLYIIHMFE